MSKLAPITSTDHTDGPASAAVTLVEYGDYQCPSCGEAAPVVAKLKKHFGDKLRVVFRHFPLEQHPYAEHAAEAAEFAAAHEKFWQMHEALYKHQRELGDETLGKLANNLGLNADELAKAFAAKTYVTRVKHDLASGEAAGVEGTPWFYINGKAFDGGADYEAMLEAIETEVSAAK